MTIQLFQPQLQLQELLAVADVMRSNWIGKGQRVKQFEADFARHLQVSPDNLVSTTSCTEALFQIMELIGVEGQEVIIPSIHFIGAANAVIANGGIPVFCDVNPRTLNTEAWHIEPHINSRTKAIILLHYGGYLCDIEPILDLAKKRNLIVIEDSACSPDTWDEQDRAAGTIADFGVWSFDAMKIISTGDGGMIYAKDPDQIAQLRNRMYLGQGDVSGYTSDKAKWWEFESCYPGRRAIMNDLTAAIGIEQLKKLKPFVGHRSTLAHMYLTSLPAEIVPVREWARASHYFFWIQTDRRDELARYLKDRGIYTSFRYYPLHQALGIRSYVMGYTEWAADRTLLLPLHQGLNYYDVENVCECVREFLGDNSR